MIGGEESYGKLFLREHRADLMDAWMAPHGIIEYIPKVESIGILVPVKGEYNASNMGGIKVTNSHTRLNMRDVGMYFTLEHNFRSRLMDYMRSEQGYDLVIHLNKLGYKIEDVHMVGIGFVPEKAIFEVAKYIDGTIAIKAHKDYFRKIENEAKSYGMETGELMEVAIAEELTHLFRGLKPRFSQIGEEKATKTMLKEFYEGLERSTSNPRLKAKYERIIRRLSHDIETVGRYAEMYHSDRGKLEAVLEAEAILERGLDGDEVSEYVAARLEEIATEAEIDSEYSLESEASDADYDGDVAMCEAEGAPKGDGEDCGAEGEAACAEAAAEGGGESGGD